MLRISLEELGNKYATSTQRKELFGHLCEEIQDWKEHTTALKVWVYGSFITREGEPNDIDVLASCVGFSLKERHKDVHVRYEVSERVRSKQETVDWFNAHPYNIEKGIRLSIDEVTELVL